MTSDPEPARSQQSPRRTVASYDSYSAVEQAVDHLSDHGFPVERVAIVGRGLRLVEQVSGRVTTGRAALAGAGQGAFVGLVFALLFGLFFTYDNGSFLGVLLYALVVGALFGALFAAVMHAGQGGRRDFASSTGMQADCYDLEVDEEVAGAAEELLTRAQRAAADAV